MPLRIHHFGLIVILEEPISESKRYPNGTSCSVACPSSWCRAANVPTRQVEGCESGQRGFSVAPPAVARDIAVQGMQDSKVRFDTRVTASHERAGSVAVEHPSRPGCHRQVRSGHPIPDRLDSNDDRSATVTTAQPGYREVAQRRTACGLGTGHPRWEYRCLPFRASSDSSLIVRMADSAAKPLRVEPASRAGCRWTMPTVRGDECVRESPGTGP